MSEDPKPKKKHSSKPIASRPGPAAPGSLSLYRAEYCDMLVQHAKSGGSFESFAAKTGTSIQTLYAWMGAHPAFLEARKKAHAHLHVFYEGLGVAIASGQLKRVVSEEPMVDLEGQPMLDPNNGQVLMKRTYEPVSGNSTAWIFLTKNLLGWRNDVEISLNLPGQTEADAPIEISDGMSPEERFREMQEMMEVIKQIQEEDEAIDVTPAKQA